MERGTELAKKLRIICLCQKRKNALIAQKSQKYLWGVDTAPCPDPTPTGEGTPLARPHPPRRLRRLDSATSASRHYPAPL